MSFAQSSDFTCNESLLEEAIGSNREEQSIWNPVLEPVLMGEAGDGMAGEPQDDTEEDVGDVLAALGHFVRKIEDERGDSRKIFPGNSLSVERALKHLTEKQRLSIRGLLGRYTLSPTIQALSPMPRSEMHYYLGLSHEKGLFGVRRSHRRAFEHYIIAAQLGSPAGTFRVAQCYEKGIGKKRNMRNALHFYRCAAKLGLVEAMHTYGVIILFGEVGDGTDLEIGVFYLRLAAKKASHAYPYALYDLGRCYEGGKGPDIISPDDSYAFKLYLKGASLDCPNCQFRVARCLEAGEMGQEKDVARAVEWYAKATDLGQSDAQLRLSVLFLNGLENVVERNYKLGFRLGLKAAARENISAAYLVSDCYEQGVGVKKNTLLARWWSRIAGELRMAQGEPPVERVMMVISDEDSGIEQLDFEDGMAAGLIKAQ